MVSVVRNFLVNESGMLEVHLCMKMLKMKMMNH